jgi:hypothetical protein
MLQRSTEFEILANRSRGLSIGSVSCRIASRILLANALDWPLDQRTCPTFQEPLVIRESTCREPKTGRCILKIWRFEIRKNGIIEAPRRTPTAAAQIVAILGWRGAPFRNVAYEIENVVRGGAVREGPYRRGSGPAIIRGWIVPSPHAGTIADVAAPGGRSAPPRVCASARSGGNPFPLDACGQAVNELILKGKPLRVRNSIEGRDAIYRVLGAAGDVPITVLSGSWSAARASRDAFAIIANADLRFLDPKPCHGHGASWAQIRIGVRSNVCPRVFHKGKVGRFRSEFAPRERHLCSAFYRNPQRGRGTITARNGHDLMLTGLLADP